MPIEVLQPGLSTTVQDRGRIGYYEVGIPPSGALDQYSLLAANLLVGNDDEAAGLECVYMGPQLRFTAPTVVAVAGAEMTPRVNGEERPLWEAFSVAEDDVLDFAYLTGGARAYIGIAGGIDTAPVLGSRSTYALGAMGGYDGRPLQAGDTLPTPSDVKGEPGRSVAADLRQETGPSAEIRVVMGLYDHR
ncbi:MAG TPA: biotin-dependent carboxyltransferase family protein, partial [Acidimicrobiia bacterium]|nr:biotin-dependent carboxyltransferase family protein [Acidimicrobiia bacterium]